MADNNQNIITLSKSKNIILRAKKTTSAWSLYLDLRSKNKRIFEFLKLYISTDDKRRYTSADKSTLNLAEAIKAQRQLELNTGTYGLVNYAVDTFVADYFRDLMQERINRVDPSRWKWKACHAHFYQIFPTLTFDLLNVRIIEQFKQHLLATVGRNTASTYWQVFGQMLSIATKERIIPRNPMDDMTRGIGRIDAHREFLIQDELILLDKKICTDPVVKNAFLFSCFCGLRFGDIQHLKYEDIHREGEEYVLYFRQRKTSQLERIFLAKQALKYINIGQKSGKIFQLTTLRVVNSVLKDWVKPEITKHITFHCARHTFATLALNIGIDLKTVSALLGHKEIRTTEIYARIINKTKQEAVAMLPEL